MNFLSDVEPGKWRSLGSLELDSEKQVSRRQLLRDLRAQFGEVANSFEALRDEFSNKPRQELVPHFQEWLRLKRRRLLFLSYFPEREILVLADRKGHLSWCNLGTNQDPLAVISSFVGERDVIVPHFEACKLFRRIGSKASFDFTLSLFPEPEFQPDFPAEHEFSEAKGHLGLLEREAIEIIRISVASANKPGMLFSMGKDSMVMLRLAEKAFAPFGIPFPILGIDTRWKFSAMYRFRAWLEGRSDLDYKVFVNPEAIEQDTNPFKDGSALHTEITKTDALKKLLTLGAYDFVFGGARRDEEKSRAKERIFSVRDSQQRWNPREQRPELWNSYNTLLVSGQTMRVFPLSNWTERDIWEYIEAERIPLVPLYFSALRPVVERNGSLIMLDDERFPLDEGELVQWEWVRFRTLGCYPLTGATVSSAVNLSEIREELGSSLTSERSTRVIDSDSGASMEQKKREGYF